MYPQQRIHAFEQIPTRIIQIYLHTDHARSQSHTFLSRQISLPHG